MHYREYEVWHDECKNNSFQHGILFIPSDKKLELLSYLKQIRNEFNVPFYEDHKFAGCLKKEKYGRLIYSHLTLLSHILKSKVKHSSFLRNISGKSLYYRNYTPYLELADFFGCKFGFLSNENYLRSFNCSSYSKKVELTFKFILKGCCHSFFSNKNPIIISSFHFDGYKHLGASFDKSYLTNIFLRSYCELSSALYIDSKHFVDRDEDSKLIMNFVDNAVSGFSAAITCASDPYNILTPLNDIISRARSKKTFVNPNSEWFRSASFSQVEIINNSITFSDLFKNKDQIVFDFY